MPPASAADTVRDLAADGWSIVGIAHRLGIDPKTFNLWLEREPALQDAIDLGREQERRALCNMLFRKAIEKEDTTAAAILLNGRHGFRRDDQADQGNRVNIAIALPGPLSIEQFRSITKGTNDVPKQISAG